MLSQHPALTGWLHRSTRYAALDAIRAEQRRQQLNELLAAMPDAPLPSDARPDWERLRPVLDEAVDELDGLTNRGARQRRTAWAGREIFCPLLRRRAVRE